MRRAEPFFLTITKLFRKDLDSFLLKFYPEYFDTKEYFYFLFNHLVILESIYKNLTFFHLDKEKLRKLTFYNIDSYILILKKGGFILCDEKFIPNQKAKWYKINSNYLKSDVEVIELGRETLISKRLKKKIDLERNHTYRLPDYLKQMRKAFMEIELNYLNAKLEALTYPKEEKRIVYLNSILRLKNKRMRYFKRNKTNNRLDTNITNLKSDFRKFFIGDYVNIDLKNSQPLLLLMLIKLVTTDIKPLCWDYFASNLFPTFGSSTLMPILRIHQKSEFSKMVDLLEFQKQVVTGKFYDEIVNQLNGTITRKEAKEMMFKVLFSKNVAYSKYKSFIPFEAEKEIFEKLYPTVYQIIFMLKKKDHTKLSVYLQKMESHLIIDIISKELVENGIIPITIHDSFIIPKRDETKAFKIIKEQIKNQLGFEPSFGIESLKG